MSHRRAFEHAYAIILAGGSGTRFWPLSRRKNPKQLLELFGRGTMVEQSVARIAPCIPAERIYVFTNEILKARIRRLLPQIPADQIVAEPVGRNTAPTIGLAGHEVLSRDPEGIMIVLPSDHVISKPAAFRQIMREACGWASGAGRTVVLGLKPTGPETGYGYVRIGDLAGKLGHCEIYGVRNFTEKPPLKTARRYVASGKYLWNGGMFIWRADTVLESFAKHQPTMSQTLRKLAEAGGFRNAAAFRRLFPKLESISIDFGIMEKISGVFAVPADIGWNDVGSWSVVYNLNDKDPEGNVLPRNSFSLNSRGNLVRSEEKFVATVGVQNLVIVETPDALLVCTRDAAQDVGKIVKELSERGLTELL
jgi:mannose-1-phosphate guanylyltransferase